MYHPSSNLSRNSTAVLTRAHVQTSCFSFRGALRDKLLRKLHSVTGPGLNTKPRQLATLNFQPLQNKLLRKLRSVTGPLQLPITHPRHLVTLFLDPVHTTPCSNENDTVLFRCNSGFGPP